MHHTTATGPSALLHKNGSRCTASTSQDEVIKQLPLSTRETSMTDTSTIHVMACAPKWRQCFQASKKHRYCYVGILAMKATVPAWHTSSTATLHSGLSSPSKRACKKKTVQQLQLILLCIASMPLNQVAKNFYVKLTGWIA